MGMKTPREKYETDRDYHVLVDTLTAQIQFAKFTPSEVREAALFACIRYEMLNMRPVIIRKNEEATKAADTLLRWVDAPS